MCDRGNRHWILTLNNETDMVKFRELCEHHKCERVSAQVERAPTTGTLHIQAYVAWKEAKTLTSVKSKFGKTIHAEVCKDPLGSWEYCRKADTRVSEFPQLTIGNPPRPSMSRKGDRKQHNRNLLAIGAVEAAKEGLIDLHRFQQVDSAIRVINAHDRARPPDLDKLDNYWYYGASGVGKSRKARADHPDLFNKDFNQWWCHYAQQDTVLLDDIDPDHKWMARHLKVWADHYPFMAQIKCGQLGLIRPKTIIVTSQYRPEDIFSPEDTKAIRRRFTVINMNQPI